MLQRYKVAELDINGCDAVNEDAHGDYVEWDDLLPLLREARWAAELVKRSNEGYKNHHAVESVKRAQALLNQLDATKGVEG